MAEVDPVILQLIADDGRYRSQLLNTTRLAETSFGRQERSVQSLERQIKASSGAIGNQLRNMASGIAAGLSAQQIASMADSYTRFTNQLRVAGLEGEALAKIQERLFEVAQQNGIQLEAVGTLYSRAAQNQKELGASTADLVNLTRAVAASLRISGTSTQEASGALLQLGQALGSPRIQAEEFNSLLDTMQPLLREASKYIDGTGNSLAGLTRKIKDTKGEGVSNVELFQAITKAMADLEKTAGSATLTISAAFTNLSNALTKYIGEADRSGGASATLAAALDALSKNIGTLATALAVISTVLLGRFVAGAVASTGALVAQGVATQRLAAQQAFLDAMLTKTIATNAIYGSSLVRTTTLLGTAGAAARAAGASMLAAFGGPIGVATALGIAIVALVQNQDDSTAASRAQADAIDKAKASTSGARDAMEKLATATGKAREEALAHARAKAQETQRMLEAARAAVIEANAKVRAAKAEYQAKSALVRNLSVAGNILGVTPGGVAGEGAIQQAEAQQAAALATFGSIFDDLEALKASISGGAAAPAASATAGSGKKKPKDRGASGPSAAELEQRHLDELSRIRAEQIQAEIAVTTDTERRAELRGDLNELEYRERLRGIQNSKEFNDKQRAAQVAALNKLYGRDKDGNLVASDQGLAMARQQQEEENRNRAQLARDSAEALEAEAQLTDGRRVRLAIERAIIEQRGIEARASLEAAIASGQVADAVKARANLERKLAADRQGVEREYESPFQSYARRLRNQGENIGDEVESLVVQRLDEVDDAITDAISSRLGVKDPLLKSLLNLFLQQVLIRPVAEALSAAGGAGGIGGFFGNLFGSIFGRASGGYVAPGQTVRVNEGRGGVELLRMGSQGGTVIPLGQVDARAARPAAPTINAPLYVDARGAVMNDQFASMILSKARGYAAEAGAASYQKSMRDAPGRVAQARRFGSG